MRKDRKDGSGAYEQVFFRTASGIWAVREAVLRELPPEFPLAELVSRFPAVPVARLRRVLAQLKREGRLERRGSGRGARWMLAQP